ncbi:MAG: TAXI family TRAP transporter solute-binding subunit [Cocleimonas sp.]|nr:TAXI family TRAP transporter solute-binding subunit [Cocleimonas sp.]
MSLIQRFIFLFLLSYIPASFADEIGLLTGPKTGTYTSFGQQIAAISKKQGVTFEVKTSSGAVENIQRMMSNENAALGFVQSDVMSYLLQSKKQKLKAIAKKLRIIVPFYSEEVHVLASKKIKTLQDLEGKRVYVGSPKSGTSMTASNIFNLLSIQPQYVKIPVLTKGKDHYVRAIALLLTGKIDAIFYVSGKPLELFSKKLKTVMQSGGKQLESVHFLPLDQAVLLDNTPYSVSSLNHPAYQFINKGTDIPTLAVQSLLISFDFSKIDNHWSPVKKAYYQRRCQQIHTLFQTIKKNLNTLKKTGHEKWKKVNLDQNVGLWKRSQCALSGNKTKPQRTNPFKPCQKIKDPVEQLECKMELSSKQ